MSAVELPEVTPPAPPPPPAPPQRRSSAADYGWFLGREGEFFRLVARGAVFLMLTLGIYRFWLATDIRRYLWSRTEVAGEALEYTGTPRELLLGFLMALAFLLPINGLIFLSSFLSGLLSLLGIAGVALLALLGQFALYRARRYRLSRTIYRGIRLFQTGSGWVYALRSTFWTVVILLTLGLAYPWASASLERYKLKHTHYGNLDGRFEGRGSSLFARGFLLWAIVVGPAVAALIAALISVDWNSIAGMFAEDGTFRGRVDDLAPAFAAAVVLAAVGGLWSLLAAMLLYPAFRAITLRWWISGLRLGEVAAVSRLRAGQIYRAYLRFLGFSMLFGIIAGIVVGIVLAIVGALSYLFGESPAVEISGAVLGIAAYVFMALGYSAIYQATVLIRFWRLSFEMTELTGLETLDRVEARGRAASPLGEGLADALDVGGL